MSVGVKCLICGASKGDCPDEQKWEAYCVLCHNEALDSARVRIAELERELAKVKADLSISRKGCGAFEDRVKELEAERDEVERCHGITVGHLSRQMAEVKRLRDKYKETA